MRSLFRKLTDQDFRRDQSIHVIGGGTNDATHEREERAENEEPVGRSDPVSHSVQLSRMPIRIIVVSSTHQRRPKTSDKDPTIKKKTAPQAMFDKGTQLMLGEGPISMLISLRTGAIKPKPATRPSAAFTRDLTALLFIRKRTSNPTRESHARSKQRPDKIDRQPIVLPILIQIASSGDFSSVVVGAVVFSPCVDIFVSFGLWRRWGASVGVWFLHCFCHFDKI
jgi:hypothetical protein